MSADLINPIECTCCEPGTSRLVAAISVGIKRGEGYANASKVSADGLLIAELKGYDLADFVGFFRTITINTAYAVYSTEDENYSSSWVERLTLTHIGPTVVESPNDIEFNTADTSDDPPEDPLYISYSTILPEESEVSATGKVTIEDVKNFAEGRMRESPYVVTEALLTSDLNGYQSGVKTNEADGSAVAISAVYTPTFSFEDSSFLENASVDTEVEDGGLPLALTIFIDRYTAETGESSYEDSDTFALVWNEEIGIFQVAGVDLANPGRPWREVPYDNSGIFYHSAVAPVSVSDLWPAFIIV